MERLDLKVNDRIEVITEEKAYRSLILDVEEDFILINLPVNDGEYLMVNTGEVFEMNLYSDDGRCFNFFGNLLSKGKEGNVLYYKLTSPYNIKKVQRRNFFRVDTLNEVEYKIITDKLEKEISLIPYEKSTMLDLSGGGIRMKLSKKINADDTLLVKFHIKDKELMINGQVLRIENISEKECICGIKFLNITQNETDIIVEELFKIMREQRAKL